MTIHLLTPGSGKAGATIFTECCDQPTFDLPKAETLTFDPDKATCHA